MPNDNPKQIVKQVAAQEGRPEEKVVETIQLVSFELDKEEYASSINDLREIIKIREIVPIPGAPGYIGGILNVRGQIVVVVDLEKRFSIQRNTEAKREYIIIVEVENTIFGILVDQVTGVLRVPVTTIKAAPELVKSRIHADYLKGVVVLEGEKFMKPVGTVEPEKGKKETEVAPRLLLLLDIPKMLSEKELLQFGNVIKETIQETVKS